MCQQTQANPIFKTPKRIYPCANIPPNVLGNNYLWLRGNLKKRNDSEGLILNLNLNKGLPRPERLITVTLIFKYV